MNDENKNNEKFSKEYIKEYTEVLTKFADLAAKRPDLIDSMRDSLKISSQLMYSNKPEAVSEFQTLAEEIDSFLQKCKPDTR
ncbi:MAG: hypothetical protein U9N77_02910 [Thermodesulfobacteriota bacterium]|nr:hypothetical protein [Thermodesulfobacteriota bacterium]